MIKTHKRKKTSRARGSKTQGWGFRQKHKGHGNKGGRGMSGSGDHRKEASKDLDKNRIYFGKQGFASRGTAKKKYDKINLRDIKANMFSKDGCSINLPEHKILGDGIGFNAKITAKSASVSAIEKMAKAGGSIITTESKEEKETVKKTESPKKEVVKKAEAPKKDKKPSSKK